MTEWHVQVACGCEGQYSYDGGWVTGDQIECMKHGRVVVVRVVKTEGRVTTDDK